MNGEREPLDLSEYISGKRKMMLKCINFEKCGNRLDITKEFIMMETQNNIRKQSPDYDPNCDELVILSGRYCDKCKTTHQKGSTKECVCCGREDFLRYCEYCKAYFCNYDDNIIDNIGGCFGFTSSHEPNCTVIFNYHHPNLDEEMAFYDRLRYFENNMVVP